MEKHKGFMTRLEEIYWGGSTWATESTGIIDRLEFYNKTKIWPGMYSKETTASHLQARVNRERSEGELHLAEETLTLAQEAGLDIT